jgi:serine/threonine protein kinase
VSQLLSSLQNAAESLEGIHLDGEWVVDRKVPRPPTATGGNFCVGYLVSHPDGRRGFLKALNYAMAFRISFDTVAVLNQLTQSFMLERDLLRHCGDSGMSHVVISITDGVAHLDGYPIPTVNYIIFELAKGDVRAELDKVAISDTVFRLQCIHHVAVGLRQLHNRRIAHQDLKPSNVLVFDDIIDTRSRVSKVSDLGRATAATRPAEHDDFPIAGDYTYAPPEQLYGWATQEFGPRRLACDLYQLGSLVVFMFTGVTLNAALNMELLPIHSWNNWQGSYEEVLPYLRDAFGCAMRTFENSVPVEISKELTSLVFQLCDPDPALRGHLSSRKFGGNPYSLDRIVSNFNLLAHRATCIKKTVSR